MASECSLSIVIPVYGSERYLAATVSELCDALAARDFELILVNDGSPDGVQTVIDSLCAADPRVRQIWLAHNVGQHRATLCGFAAALGDVVVTIDDDGQNPPSAVLAVDEALRAGDHDVVYGRFHQVEQHGLRRLASRLNRQLSRMTLSNRAAIAITNVRAVRGDLARWLGSTQSSYPYIDALLFRVTNYVAEVPVEHRTRESGESTYSLWKLLRLWLSHLTSLTILPLQLATIGSFGASALGFTVGIVQMLRALTEQRAPEGWLSLFTAVAFLFSILFAFLGILSFYLGRMYVTMNEPGLVWSRKRSPAQDASPRSPEGGPGSSE